MEILIPYNRKKTSSDYCQISVVGCKTDMNMYLCEAASRVIAPAMGRKVRTVQSNVPPNRWSRRKIREESATENNRLPRQIRVKM